MGCLECGSFKNEGKWICDDCSEKVIKVYEDSLKKRPKKAT